MCFECAWPVKKEIAVTVAVQPKLCSNTITHLKDHYVSILTEMLKQFYSQSVKGAHVWIKDAPTGLGTMWVFNEHLHRITKVTHSQTYFSPNID